MSAPASETTLRPVAVMVCELLDDPHFRASLVRELQARSAPRDRTDQLVLALEAWRVELPMRDRVVEPAAPPPISDAPRRVLVIAGDEPEAVLLRSYGERLAWDLAAAGHSVVITRARRGRLAPRPAGDREPTLLELEAGPLPAGTTLENQRLLVAGPFHRRLERLVREHGPFDVLLAEGLLGQLSGPPLATQFGLPLLLALDGCEVARRKNQLSREQLHTAELEHWAADRARAVLVPEGAVESALREHYKLTSTVVVAPWAARLRRPSADNAARLLRQLAIEAPFVLVLGRDMGDDERRSVLEGAPGRTIVLAERGLWLRGADGSIACLYDRPVVGPALGALIASAEVVVGTVGDVHWHEAQVLASRVALAGDGVSLERTLRDAAAPRPRPDSTALLEDVLAQLPGRATSSKEAQVAHGLR